MQLDFKLLNSNPAMHVGCSGTVKLARFGGYCSGLGHLPAPQCQQGAQGPYTIQYIPRAQSGSHITTLGRKYILCS